MGPILFFLMPLSRNHEFIIAFSRDNKTHLVVITG